MKKILRKTIISFVQEHVADYHIRSNGAEQLKKYWIDHAVQLVYMKENGRKNIAPR